MQLYVFVSSLLSLPWSDMLGSVAHLVSLIDETLGGNTKQELTVRREGDRLLTKPYNFWANCGKGTTISFLSLK